MTALNPDDLGTLARLPSGRLAVRYERLYSHRPEHVWEALVQPAALSSWFPARIDGLIDAVREGRVPAPLRFVFERPEWPVLDGELRLCDPPRLLEFTWADDVLRFELTPSGPEGRLCLLVFLTTFTERSSASRDATGWHLCLENLHARLDGAPTFDRHGDFPPLYRAYMQRLGVGEFPRFLSGDDAAALHSLFPAPHAVGRIFVAADGTSMVTLRFPVDSSLALLHTPRGAYLSVLEGELVLRLGGGDLVLSSSMEFHVPEGAEVTATIKADTRLIFSAPG